MLGMQKQKESEPSPPVHKKYFLQTLAITVSCHMKKKPSVHCSIKNVFHRKWRMDVLISFSI